MLKNKVCKLFIKFKIFLKAQKSMQKALWNFLKVLELSFKGVKICRKKVQIFI